jgi:ferredoxin--NADP+ reductase
LIFKPYLPSRDEKGDFHGRLTAYLKNHDIDKDIMVYLCGNSDMVFESIDILKEKGLSNFSYLCAN